MDCRFIIGIFFGGNYQISKILFVSPNQYHIRFSYGSGEWRNGADPWLHAVVPEPSSHPPRTEGIGMIDVLCCRHTEEATEIASDAEGRWFSFNVDMNSILLMERKGMPVHLQGLPCVECACDLSTIIHELEDAGEVKGSKPVYVLEKQQVWFQMLSKEYPLIILMLLCSISNSMKRIPIDHISVAIIDFKGYPKNIHSPYFWCYVTIPVGQIGDQPPFPESRADSSDIRETVGFCPWAPKTRWWREGRQKEEEEE